MAFQTTPQGVEVVIKGRCGGEPIVNVHHVDVHTDVTVGVMNNVLTAYEDWATASFLPLLSDQYTLEQIVVKDISVADGIEVTNTYTTGNTGGSTAPAIANNVALVSSLRTIRTGRSFRGRMYWGGIPKDVQDTPTTVTTIYATAVQGAIQDLIDALEAIGYTLSVLSRVALGVKRATGLLTEIVSIVQNLITDSQRRRDGN